MIKFIDAKEMSFNLPEKFQRPSEKDLDNIKSGDLVKICYENERFWIIVKLVETKNIIGTIDNNLFTTKLKYGDNVKFTKDNIYDIYQEKKIITS